MLKEISKSMSIKADLNNLAEVSEFVRSTLSEGGLDEKFCNQIDIVVEEIFVNIASYAYSGEKGDAVVECKTEGDSAVLVFKDHGIEYNPLKKEDPVIGDPDNMTIGGYGIFMVRNIMDEVSYEYDEQSKENILTMRKIKKERQ